MGSARLLLIPLLRASSVIFSFCRQALAFMHIDWQKSPARFKQQLNTLLYGKDDIRIKIIGVS
jgi:hypothetical protein